MNISAISNNYNPNFGITSKVRIPMNDGTTTLLNVTGEVKNNGTIKITKIIGEILSRGKVINKTKKYENKKGFDDQRFAVISEELSLGAKEPDTVIDQILESIRKPNISYNA